jgi:hypothetical protein
LEIRNWTFCDGPNTVTGCLARGETLEVNIIIKALQDTVQQLSNVTFLVGPEVVLLTNWEAEVDSEIQRIDLPTIFEANATDIFPSLPLLNSIDFTTNLLQVRFPRFTDFVLWDFLIY